MVNVAIVSCHDDGEVEKEDGALNGFEYLHVNLKVDGEIEGSLSGYFKPELAAFVRNALTQHAEALWVCKRGQECGQASCEICGEDPRNSGLSLPNC